MELVASLTSPFARKIRVHLLEKGLPFQLHESIPWNADTDVSQYNPLGKVPALVDDNGHIWTDSPVISEFIETLPGHKRLIPESAYDAVCVRQIEALADGVCEAAIAIFLEKKRTPEKQSGEWITRQTEKLTAGFKALEKKLGDKHYFFNDELTIADIAVVCFLEWFSFRFPENTWQTSYPKLNEFVIQLGQRESFINTQPSA